MPLRDDLPNHTSRHIRQPHISPVIRVRQLLVIHAHQMQNGRVQIIHRGTIFDRVQAVLVRRAVDRATLHSTASHPHREPLRIVIPAVQPL